MSTAFLAIQGILLLFMALHEPPFNDVEAVKREDSLKKRLIGTAVNTLWVAFPLALTLSYFPGPYPGWVKNSFVLLYAILSVGTLLSWWIPYFLGSSKEIKVAFKKFKKTHHFLPSIKDHVVPNTLHVLLHLQVWACLVISVILFNP